MKNLILIVIIVLASFSAYADENQENVENTDATKLKSTVNFGTEAIVTKRDYRTMFADIGIEYGFHSFRANYKAYRNLLDKYDKLEESGLTYFYFSPDYIFGANMTSTGDAIYDVMETVTFTGTAAKSVYQNSTDSSYMNLYVGVAAASTPIFYNSYVFPVLAFAYRTDMLTLNIGVPVTMISITPVEKHTISFEYAVNVYDLSYQFDMTENDSFKFSYKRERSRFAIKDIVKKSNMDNYRLMYERDWLEGEYTRKFHPDEEYTISASVYAGYMPLGYKFEGKYFHRKPSERLKTAMRYGINVKFDF